MPRVPVFDGLWSQTPVCVWDVAAAHLTFEDALRRDPANVSGEAFLITGDGPQWSVNDSRAALKVTFPSNLIYYNTSDLEAHVVLLPSQLDLRQCSAVTHLPPGACCRGVLVPAIPFPLPLLCHYGEAPKSSAQVDGSTDLSPACDIGIHARPRDRRFKST
jgi:hypothetical protein